MDIELAVYYVVDIVLPAIGMTLFILLCTSVVTGIFGTILGVVLYVTKKDGLYPHPRFNFLLGLIVNIVRAIPIIIFIVLMMPVARAIIGTAIGEKAAIFYISIMCTPFMGRVVEGKLQMVDKNLIEAAKSMGISNIRILFSFVMHEAVPMLVTGYSFATIIILGTIALAGTVGAGGIGAVAMNYGYRAFNGYVMYGSIAILVIMVIVIQWLGRLIYKKVK